jgi:cobalt/nickel transport system ATP-binding protein
MTHRRNRRCSNSSHVTFRYPDGNVGLDGCSLTIARGSRNALIGANGAGKTTLFQHANGLLRPQSGAVRYAGQPLDYSRAGCAPCAAQIGLVFQNPDQQLFSASVQEDVSFGPLNLGLDMDTVRQRVSRPAGRAHGRTRRPAGAQPEFRPEKARLHRRRAGHGTATADPRRTDGRPRPRHAPGTAGRARPPARQGITLLLATHDIDFAYRWADRIHLMAAAAAPPRSTPRTSRTTPRARRRRTAGAPASSNCTASWSPRPPSAGQSPRSIGELTELIKHQGKSAQ